MQRCSSEAADTYRVSRRNEDNLLKKSLPVRGTLMVFKWRLHFYTIGIVMLIAAKGKSSLMIFDRHANLKYKYVSRSFWCRGYYVDTGSKNK